MKHINILISTFLLLSIFSCTKDIDNLEPSPSIKISNYEIMNQGDNTYQKAFQGKILRNGNARISFEINAPSKIEQIDFKGSGVSGDNITLSKGGQTLAKDNVPFDWVGLQTIRVVNGEKNVTLTMDVKEITTKTFITLKVIDQNNFFSSITLPIEPFIKGDEYSFQIKESLLFSSYLKKNFATTDSASHSLTDLYFNIEKDSLTSIGKNSLFLQTTKDYVSINETDIISNAEIFFNTTKDEEIAKLKTVKLEKGATYYYRNPTLDKFGVLKIDSINIDLMYIEFKYKTLDNL